MYLICLYSACKPVRNIVGIDMTEIEIELRIRNGDKNGDRVGRDNERWRNMRRLKGEMVDKELDSYEMVRDENMEK